MRKFLKQFTKNPKTVGSIFPSSSKLIHSMLKHIDFTEDLMIVEYWAWIGNFTKQILKKSTPGSKLFVFEIHNEFVEELNKIKDPRVQIVHDWAENVWKYLDWKRADVIVSWLPFWSLPKELTKTILAEWHKHLRMWWLFVQFQYFLQNKKDIHNTFKNHAISWQPLNIPPAFVYRCDKIHE
ncbi:MAG: phospholipid N-methyltransferase [uncultured bacterium (gcode 4)]|uniref:Phospholipid N-methyltransferase n=1 Tax=uncultured bacterium (gcode 4) TaxID=1234023 RepID=K2G359_9BACT|nr:MAG: phospholipid N-methyltransferase [uncultured bacterium (gcode 4)]